jgi:alkylhydroperoxidase/carboxymuconolactone decarboxylase family protein YurZ
MEDSNKTFSEKGVLPARLNKLIALASALAGQRSQDVASWVKESLRVGATREEIMEVLRIAIVMAEIPAEHYTEIVQNAIKVFEAED